VNAQWNRLSPKSIVALTMPALAPYPVTILVMALAGARPAVLALTTLLWVLGALLLAAAVAVGWYFTKYRVTEERFELRQGILLRSHRSIPRDRIRSVDLTAAVHFRLFGLTVLRIGTGEQGSGATELRLTAVDRQHAEEMRTELLPRTTAPGTGTPDEELLARMRPAWFGYSPLTFSSMLIVWGAIASAIGSFSDLFTRYGVWRWLLEEARLAPVLLAAAVTGLFLATGLIGSLLVNVEMWWDFRLHREASALRVLRGLLTSRSISLEQRRMRGVEIAEPLLLRWFGGARLKAITTGLSEQHNKKQPESNALLPPAPRDEAHRVAAVVLREPGSPLRAEFARHPRVALRRRLTWALVPALVIDAALAALWWRGWLPSTWTAVLTVVVLASAVAFAVDAYRNLGHRLAEHYLLVRSGTAVRRTAALQRRGIIGWRIRQSFFQRRAGVATVSATTAAGAGIYHVRDVEVGDGVRLADEATPGLLTPFLEQE
jgi:putative membrane protein